MIESIFPTPLYFNIAKDQELKDIQSEISNIINNIKYDYIIRWGKTHKMSFAPSDAEPDVIAQYDLTNFKNFVQQNIYEYLDNLNYQGNREYKMESWVAAYELNDYASIHDHGNSDLSGVYYFQTNTSDGNIMFYNPASQVNMTTCFKNSDLESWTHPPQVGKILIFPGYLRHGVLRNVTADTRIAISFNAFFQK
tara:strand:- start:5185 stop:5769 length:585 start_codon:yes stop_codon:yes gene_type:complete